MLADGIYKDIRLSKPWVITLYPTQGFADLEELSLEEYAQVVVSASTFDPRLLDEVEEPIRAAMAASRTVRILTEHPRSGKSLELAMSIAGRRVRKCTGEHNIPDGEVFTSPDARTPDGEIFVDLPISNGGTTIRGVHLRFEKGVIREYSAEIGGEALARVIETDEGSHRLGEVALGMNAGVTRALRHPLFAEKVGGTLHIAIGASYPECFVEKSSSAEGVARCEELFREGALNRSAQHVDIVTDFRDGGCGRAVFFDDTRLEVRNGIWQVRA
jgi:aminopeptidase